MENSVCGLQYQADHTECFAELGMKIAKGLKGRIIFDKSCFMRSSCVRQALRVQELYRAGCEMKIVRPSHGGFAVMHVKTLIFDERVVLTGSVNMTHNGHENNKEHLFRLTEPTVVADVMKDFEKDWAAAEEVEEKDIEQMMNNHAERNTKEKSVPRVPSASRSFQKSKSQELVLATAGR